MTSQWFHPGASGCRFAWWEKPRCCVPCWRIEKLQWRHITCSPTGAEILAVLSWLFLKWPWTKKSHWKQMPVACLMIFSQKGCLRQLELFSPEGPHMSGLEMFWAQPQEVLHFPWLDSRFRDEVRGVQVADNEDDGEDRPASNWALKTEMIRCSTLRLP